jgi:drug/metabolite transporter (DMT)-like permease
MRATPSDYILLVALSLFWGTGFVAIEFALLGFTPVALASTRLILAALFLYALVRLRGERLPTDRDTWMSYIVIGVAGLSLPFVLIGWAQVHITAGLSAMIVAVTPIFTMILSHIIIHDNKITPRELLGLLIGFIGVFYLVGGWEIIRAPSSALAELAALAAAFGYAYSAVRLKELSRYSGTVNATGFTIVAAVVLAPVAAIYDPPWEISFHPQAFIALAYMVLISTVTGTIIMTRLIFRVSPSFMSLNNYMVPAFAAIWGTLLLDEVITLEMMVALAMILSGVAVASFGTSAATPIDTPIDTGPGIGKDLPKTN